MRYLLKRRNKKHKRLVLRISKGAFVVRVLALVLSINFLLLPTAYALTGGQEEEVTDQASGLDPNEYIRVTVQEGDTLWDLVIEHYPGRQDVRELIFEMESEQKIDALIYPGQEIFIPKA